MIALKLYSIKNEVRAIYIFLYANKMLKHEREIEGEIVQIRAGSFPPLKKERRTYLERLRELESTPSFERERCSLERES